MVFTRRKNLENSPEKAGLKSAKVSKNGGTARKVIRSASKAAFKIDRVSETERVTENERENSLKPTSPERDVETAAFNDDEMQENVTPYSLSNPVYQELENVRHNDFLFAHVKGEHASTPKIPKLIPTPRFVKKENYSTGSFRGLNEESTSNSSPFSNGLKDYPVVVTPSQPCPTPSYSHRLTPFYSETGVRERPTHFSTQNNTWDPVGFAANNLYDLTTGIPLPRLECEENLTKLAKNVRDTDYYVFLQLAQRFHNVNRDMEMLALGQAFNAAMVSMQLNKMTSRLRQAEQKNETLERESDIIKGIGFDLKKATEVEVPVELPCRKTFKISTIITAVEASKWTSSRFYGDSKNLFRFVFKAIAKRDDFFAGYSAQDNSNVGYVPYGDKFYKPIVDFVLAGFRQPRDVNTLTSLHCAARESMTNLLDRFRKEYKEKMQSTAKEVADSLKDHLFHLSLVEDSSYQLSTMLGPHKELFYERICRAAEIQRASLKNRLKSNINKFEPSTPLSFTQGGFDSSQNSLSASESQNFVVTPTTLHNLFNNSRKTQLEMLAPLASEEELMRFPAERQFDLMQIGFSYDEVKQLLEMFDKYKNDVQEINRHNTLTQMLNQFCNYISMYAPPNLKLISSAFNLLELGNPANEVKRVLLKARRREDSEESDVAPCVKKSCPSSQSPRSPNRDELLLGMDRSPPSDDGTQKV